LSLVMLRDQMFYSGHIAKSSFVNLINVLNDIFGFVTKDICARVARWTLMLSEFQYTIEHRPGTSMKHADALSQNPTTVLLADEDDNTMITKIQKAQQDDFDIMKLIEDTQQGVAKNFVLKRGILYKDCDGEVLLVVPKSMHDIIRQAHDRGHFGWQNRILNKKRISVSQNA